MGKSKRRQQNQSNQSGGKKQKQTSEKSKDEAIGSSIILTRTSPKHKKSGAQASALPISGLMNLGNTCFFNSVMQSLAQSHYFRQRMQSLLSDYQYSITLPSPRETLGSLSLTVTAKPGKFAHDLCGFIKDMRGLGRKTLNPREVFNHVCKNAPKFGTYQQQDSQELLTYLLNALKNEEVYRIKMAILEVYNVKGKTIEKRKVTEQEKKAIKAYGIQASMSTTYVDDVFGGVTVSTVTCLGCETCSEMKQDFLDLSLPVPSDKLNLTLRGSSRHKQKVPIHSSDDGDDEGEGFKSGRYKGGQNKDESKLSKHQMKQKRKEERKRSKTKQPRYSLEQFNKQTSLDILGKESGKVLTPHRQNSLDSPISRSMSEITNDSSHFLDGHLADDEKTLGSTQQDSDSSALFMKSLDQRSEIEVASSSPIDDTGNRQPPLQNFTESTCNNGSNPVLDGWNTTVNIPVNSTVSHSDKIDVSTVHGLSDGVTSLSISDNKQQNLSESIISMYENRTLSKQDDDNLTPTITTAPDQISIDNAKANQFSDDVRDTCSIEGTGCKPDNDEWIPKFGIQGREVSVTNITSPLQNIVDDKGDLPSLPDLIEVTNSSEDHINKTEPTSSSKLDETIVNENLSRQRKISNCSSKSNELELFSLEGCLKQFTSPELLTGSDRFFCDVCTERKKKQKEQLEKESTQSQLLGGTEKVVDDSSITETLTHEIENINRETVNIGEEKVPFDRKSSFSSTSSSGELKDEKDEDEDTEMLESTKESDDIDDEDSTAEEDLIFCDAKKRLLLSKLPAVLCLHLNRFTQQGRNLRNLRKNSCYISFPLILDMAPYCVSESKDLFDTNGQLLYSLYGVVVHGGGMHGGHYTAFVRERNELKLSDVTLLEDLGDHQESKSTGDNAVSILNEDNGSTSLDVDKPESVLVSKDYSVDKENATFSQEQDQNQCMSISFTGDVEEEEEVYVDGEKELLSDELKQKSHIHKDQGRVQGVERDFDLSSTEGQWYHISDSHVKLTSEAHVLNSEAYLLFYERLPFKS